MSDNYSMCFACGKDNPNGLHLEFAFEQDKYVATFIPQERYQSYSGRLHGGITATLLDEAMAAYVNELTGKDAVTARMELRYRLPVPIGEPVKVVGTLLRKKGRLYEMKGELFLADGSLAAEAAGKVFLT